MTSFPLTPAASQDKAKLIGHFRERIAERLVTLREEIGGRNFKDLTTALNKSAQESLSAFISAIESKAQEEHWSRSDLLKSVLTVTYASYVAMLEARNEVWPYEYMAFSRRIGELWENFVRLPFLFPLQPISIFVPPLFSDVRSSLRKQIADYIHTLPLSPVQKKELAVYYDKVWLLVDSGEISLELDLHIQTKTGKVNIDFKSGFGSNEKGNTNRLLMVATIYKNLENEAHSCVLLVRAAEDKNNHYFQTLKGSKVWQAFCGQEAYAKIGEYSGFPLADWMAANINWKADLAPQTYKHFVNDSLTDYLLW